jgi:hypothetical protein
MSSLRLALQLSLRENYTPNTATPVKGKKAAVPIVTPEKENDPPAAPRKKKSGPPQQEKPPPHENIIFSNVQTDSC